MQRSRPAIEFVNHASFVLEFAGRRIIQDPWLFGTAFNDGWSLLCDYGFSPERFREIDYERARIGVILGPSGFASR